MNYICFAPRFPIKKRTTTGIRTRTASFKPMSAAKFKRGMKTGRPSTQNLGFEFPGCFSKAQRRATVLEADLRDPCYKYIYIYMFQAVNPRQEENQQEKPIDITRLFDEVTLALCRGRRACLALRAREGSTRSRAAAQNSPSAFALRTCREARRFTDRKPKAGNRCKK